MGDTDRRCHCDAGLESPGADPDSSAFSRPGLYQNEIQLCSAEATASPRALPKSFSPTLADLLLILLLGSVLERSGHQRPYLRPHRTEECLRRSLRPGTVVERERDDIKSAQGVGPCN